MYMDNPMNCWTGEWIGYKFEIVGCTREQMAFSLNIK